MPTYPRFGHFQVVCGLSDSEQSPCQILRDVAAFIAGDRSALGRGRILLVQLHLSRTSWLQAFALIRVWPTSRATTGINYLKAHQAIPWRED